MAATDKARPDPQQNTGDEDYLSQSAPPGKYVKWFHREADTDASELSEHHTLGNGRNQASAGNHRHDGKSGLRLFDSGEDRVTGAKYVNGTPATGDLVNLQNQINALTALLVKLGAADNRS
jgi:hypothetical protein